MLSLLGFKMLDDVQILILIEIEIEIEISFSFLNYNKLFDFLFSRVFFSMFDIVCMYFHGDLTIFMFCY